MLLLLTVICLKQVKANDSTKPVNATILLPLYLDSAFQNTNYQFGNSLPRFLLPALEFYHGVQLAADSLREEGISARIEVIDSRKPDALTSAFANGPNQPSLVISVIQNGNELKAAASAAWEKKIPLISATYPNDAGVTERPNLLIVNSTLKSHCFAIYKYLQRYYRNNNIVLISRKGGHDDRIKNYFKEAEKTAPGAKPRWKIVSLSDSFNTSEVSVYLDSNKLNTVIGASLDKDFALRLTGTLSKLSGSYNSNIFGMPTWDELPLDKAEFKGVDVYYSTPFISFSGNASIFASINTRFKKISNSKPSDMVFKGFEITYRFIKTMYQHPNDFMAHINDPGYRVFADFDFDAVVPADGTIQIDYWENKKIYFVKKTDGLIKGVY
jgi:hypothetical protein